MTGAGQQQSCHCPDGGLGDLEAVSDTEDTIEVIVRIFLCAILRARFVMWTVQSTRQPSVN